jgi:hypothetical protein
LQREPTRDENPREDARGKHEYSKRNQGADATRWIQKEVAAKDAGMAPLAPRPGTLESNGRGNLERVCPEAAYEIEGEKASVAHRLFDVVAECEEVQHIAENARPQVPWRSEPMASTQRLTPDKFLALLTEESALELASPTALCMHHRQRCSSRHSVHTT